jgi:transposase
MPRSNQEAHLDKQSKMRDEMLKLPQARAAAQDLLSELRANGNAISVKKLWQIIKFSPAVERPDGKRKTISSGSIGLTEEKALSLLKRNLPKVLKWKPVAELANELGVHRNTVEQMVKSGGKQEMLMLAADHKLYISPKGAKLVKKEVQERRKVDQFTLLTDVAKDLAIAPNLAQSFFLSRNIPLEKDIHGRVRLSPEQIEDLSRWRYITKSWREGRPIELDGATYTPISKLAEDKAALLEVPGTKRHRVRVLREKYALCSHRKENTLPYHDKLSQYVPSKIGIANARRLSIADASKLIGVGTSTIKKWRSDNPELRGPVHYFGRRAGVNIEPFLVFARDKFLNETHLVKRGHAPAAILALPLQAAALEIGLSYRDVVNRLDISSDTAKALMSKRGVIKIDEFKKLDTLFFTDKRPLSIYPSVQQAIYFLHEVVGATCIIVSPPTLCAAVQAAALARGKSPEKIYLEMVSLFKLADVWPQTYSDLKTKGSRSRQLPMFTMTYLAAIAEPQRSIFSVADATMSSRPMMRDIVINPGQLDFGFVTRIDMDSDGRGKYKVSWMCQDANKRRSRK